MSEADAAYWDEIQSWKAAQSRPARPRVISQRVPYAALAPLGKAVSATRRIPGGETISRTVSSAAVGLADLAASCSEASVRRARIVKAHREAGHDLATLGDIRRLPLERVLAVKPRLSLAYSGGAAVEGAVSGVAASGGSLAALLGLGLASAPGVGIAASAIALDITSFVAKRGPLDAPGTGAIASAVNSLFSILGARLAARKLAQIVPVAGIVVGAGMNAALMRAVGDAADHPYREQFLLERCGNPSEGRHRRPSAQGSARASAKTWPARLSSPRPRPVPEGSLGRAA